MKDFVRAMALQIGAGLDADPVFGNTDIERLLCTPVFKLRSALDPVQRSRFSRHSVPDSRPSASGRRRSPSAGTRIVGDSRGVSHDVEVDCGHT